jgi:predicted DNA-binding transcriptional regulator AlpA
MNDLLSTADIARLLGLTRDYTTDKLTKRPGFPKPRVAISQKTRRWAREEVELWMRDPEKSHNAR